MKKINIITKIKYNFFFLTKIPVKVEINSYEEVASAFWLSPFIGWILGLIGSMTALFLFKFLPELVVGFIILGILIYFTGAHHLDGLIDFGDGIMTRGTVVRKIQVMHDVSIGAGGFSLGFIILSLTGLSIAFSKSHVIVSLLISEVCAKFSMVSACSLGKSADTEMVRPFMEKNSIKQFIYSFILTCVLMYLTIILNSIYSFMTNNISALSTFLISIKSFSIFNYYFILSVFFIAFISTFLPFLLITRIVYKNFNGFTGDCMGALNEFTRLFCLIFFLIFYSLNLI
ncbi:MAG: adenosylcobinamide-GDP ribazoletransferase [Promethearchaeota archaeon]